MRGWAASFKASQARSISGRQARAESGNDGAADHCGDGLHRFKITVGGNGKSGFDHVDTETVELVRQAQLLLMVHAAAGRLFSVAQSGVENFDADLLRGHGPSLKKT